MDKLVGMDDSLKGKLELIRKASLDIKANIDKVLKKDDKIDIATINLEAYEEDLYHLMREMADTANPVLKRMGLSKEAITSDIDEFVSIMKDNQLETYFASINLEAKYSKSRYVLTNLSKWFDRLIKSIDKIEGFLESETEAEELKRLFAMVDKTELPEKEKKKLKNEFLKTLNRLNA